MTVDFLGNKTLIQVHEIEKSTMVQEDLPPSGAREGEERPQGLSGGVGGASGIGARKKKHINMKQDSNHATRLKACAFRREFATRSQSSPLFAPEGRAGWSVRVQRGKRQNKRPEAIASGFLFWLPLLDSNQRHPD